MFLACMSKRCSASAHCRPLLFCQRWRRAPAAADPSNSPRPCRCSWCTQCGLGYALGRGECVKCQLRDTDALTRRTCKACKAAAPMYCALCVDSAGKKPMWASTSGSCKYCDDGCAKCDNGYGKCTQCKKGWTWSTVPGEFGTCMQLVTK